MLERVQKHYQSLLNEQPAKYEQDLDRIYHKLDEESIYYQGDIIPILYQPLFFSRAEIEYFNKLIDEFGAILKKVIRYYLEDPEFRSYFGFSPELEELVLTDPGYSSSVPMGRFDIFYREKDDFKFCELNTDGSSGMVKTNVLEQFFLQSEAIQDLVKKYEYNFTYSELLQNWIDTMLAKYREFAAVNKKPNIAIMDFANVGMVSEFEYFQSLLEEQGYQTVMVDPRELNYRGGKLYYKELQIDLIYRRAVTTDLMEHYSEIEDLLNAYRDQAVCLVGSFRSQIIHNKIIFAILHNEEKTDFLTAKEREFINKYIPQTKTIANDREELDNIKENREELVLKPLDFYGAKGVYIGRDLTQSRWEEIIEEINPEEYLVQEFCSIPTQKMAVFNNEGELNMESFKYTMGLFTYDLSFAGIYTRAGKENLIASSTGCVTLPNLIVDH